MRLLPLPGHQHTMCVGALVQQLSGVAYSVLSMSNTAGLYLRLQPHLQCLLQAGNPAALPVTTLRSQPHFLRCVADCTSASPPDSWQTAGAQGTQASKWAQAGSAAWQLLAEAYALTILSTEAFLYPREAGDGVCLSSHKMHAYVAYAGSSV